jgi:hypothetical protein
MTVINKQLLISESCDDSNRCKPYRENLVNTPRTLPTPVRARPAYAFCGQSPYATTFYWLPRSQNMPLHPKRSLDNQRQTDPAVVFGGLILPPMRQPCSRGERFQPNGYTATSVYWAHITSMRSIRSILAHGS